MSIDSDLRSGDIDHAEARRRRGAVEGVVHPALAGIAAEEGPPLLGSKPSFWIDKAR